MHHRCNDCGKKIVDGPDKIMSRYIDKAYKNLVFCWLCRSCSDKYPGSLYDADRDEISRNMEDGCLSVVCDGCKKVFRIFATQGNLLDSIKNNNPVSFYCSSCAGLMEENGG